MVTIDDLKFDEKGLIPAVVVDANTKKSAYSSIYES